MHVSPGSGALQWVPSPWPPGQASPLLLNAGAPRASSPCPSSDMQDPANLFSADSVTGGTYATAQVRCGCRLRAAASMQPVLCAAPLPPSWCGFVPACPGSTASQCGPPAAPSPCTPTAPRLQLAEPAPHPVPPWQVIWDAFAARYGDGKRSIALVRCWGSGRASRARCAAVSPRSTPCIPQFSNCR